MKESIMRLKDIRDELQKIHRYIRNKKLDLGWKELVDLIKEWIG